MTYSARRETVAVVRDSDGMIIGPEMTVEWAEYQAWAALGNTPAPANTLAELKEAALKAVADRRWRAEIGGMSVNGSPVATDERSQAKLVGACLAATLDADYSVQWKLGNGDFVTLDHDQIIAIAQAARAHVQACFDHEATLAGAIEAAANEQALAAIDIEVGWPA
jgi:predicted secreted protein